MAYSIGDSVIWIKNGEVYRIFATQDKPHIQNFGEIIEKLFPSEGFDYIIGKEQVAEFSSFKFVREKDIDPA